ncbi:MAG: DinB family protein [Pirellulaceae bacterium]
MKATEFVKLAMENGQQYVMELITDMKDAPLTPPTSNGGNHPLWVLGHLISGESQLFDVFICGRENRFPELTESFGMKSEPVADASEYPSMDELMQKFHTIRAASIAHLETLSDDDLDAPSHAPAELAGFGTVGLCYAALALHLMFHGGQVADARRAAGRPVLMA